MAKKGNIPWNKGLKTGSPAANSINIDIDLLKDLYINKMYTARECAEYFGCTSKTIRNKLHKYGIEVRSLAESVKLERSKWTEDQELNRSRSYHNTWINKPQDEKDLAIKKRLASPNINSNEAIQKSNQTKIKNGTSKRSKAEDNYYHQLQLMGFDKDDIVHHYTCDRYPYDCDFYIKSKDLFIEYQGHWTHGTEPFDSSNESHLKTLSNLTSVIDDGQDEKKVHIAKNIIATWAQRDPRKLKTAIDNNINLILVYPKNKTYFIHNSKITIINSNDINKI